MNQPDSHDRAYLQARLREEISRAVRHGSQFSLVIFEEAPSGDGLHLRQKMEYGLQVLSSSVREGDVVARVYDDTMAVLLIETTTRDVQDALIRMRGRIARYAGTWHIAVYNYPEHASYIESLPLLTAA